MGREIVRRHQVRLGRRIAVDPDPHGLIAEDLELRPIVISSPLDVLAQALPEQPTHTLRLLRAADLVNLRVLAYRCRVVASESGPLLVPGEDGAWMEVLFPFQHLAERAYYQVEKSKKPESTKGDTPPATLDFEPKIDLTKKPDPVKAGKSESPPPSDPPTQVRAAHGSRLVFDIPPEERIGYSTEGILSALSRLPLRVVPLAEPRKEVAKVPEWAADLITIVTGVGLTRESGRLSVRELPRSRARSHASIGEPNAAEVLRAARNGITARRLLSVESAVDFTPERVDSGRLAGKLARRPIRWKIRRAKARAPRADETAIEAPFRLFISPSNLGGFAHAPSPVSAPTDETRIELWHSRLGVREQVDGEWRVDERPGDQRAVRAVWARDMEFYTEQQLLDSSTAPFRTSLDPRDRRILVRQSAEKSFAEPEPVAVERLYLSSLGAWLDLHGEWDATPYAAAKKPSILSWDHVAPMGRDQFVRVVYPGYLFPFGHRCALVKVTERKIKEQDNPQARLYQKKFLIVSEPLLAFNEVKLPFLEIRVRPTVTPDLNDPSSQPGDNDDLFWPTIGNEKFLFTLDCLDHDGERYRLHAPLLFVAAHLPDDDDPKKDKEAIRDKYETDNVVPTHGQSVTFARSKVRGDTAVDVSTFTFMGEPSDPGVMRSKPSMVSANVVIPSMRHLAPKSPGVDVSYPENFNGFGGANAETQVFLTLLSSTEASYSEGTDRAGGFVQPDLPVTQLSRRLGAVGKFATRVDDPAGTFDPGQFLNGVLPRLFGLFDLVDVLPALGIDQLPKFMTEALDRVSALIADLSRLSQAVTTAMDRVQKDAAKLNTNAAVKAQLEAARSDLETAAGDISTQVDKLVAAVGSVLKPPAGQAPKTPAEVATAVGNALEKLRNIVDAISTAVGSLPLPPTVKAELERLVVALKPVLDGGDLLTKVLAFLDNLDPGDLSVRARYVWEPPLRPWPNATDPVFSVDDPDGKGFTLSVEARASGAGGAGVDVLAELRNFNLQLLPGEPLMRMQFDRLAFRATSGRKTEVDVVFGGIEFLGVLGFIDTLRELIPFDGFSDPPYLDVSAEGATAGFDLALPNLAVGVFSLENISLGADCRVPFLGDSVSVGFNFCTRDRPFRLTVMAIGGGGFVGIRLSPEGLVVLEMSLEAGASLSLDFGVASGSVSVMVGIYLRLEGDSGSLTGYFRIRGEVDVMGLISASITLELSLTYDFDSGKMIGRASIVVEVDVLVFSGSVEISVERRLAGSNEDPTFAQIMAVEAGKSEPWDLYCKAFAGVGAP